SGQRRNEPGQRPRSDVPGRKEDLPGIVRARGSAAGCGKTVGGQPQITPKARIDNTRHSTEAEMSAALRFNAMHFMPYVHLPENHKDFKTTWVNFPNKFYDPEKGYELYQRYF